MNNPRVATLNHRGTKAGDYVLYWMQQSQRADFNHALEYAIQQANALERPLLVGFGLMDNYPEATLRHYRFMLEGLKETQETLAGRGIPMVVRRGSPDAVALTLARKAALVVCDCGYLRHQKTWRARVAWEAKCSVVQVEADVVVPVDVASDKAEVGARTLRPRLQRVLDTYLVPLPRVKLRHHTLGVKVAGISLASIERVLGAMDLDTSVGAVSLFRGGTSEANKLLRRFLRDSLAGYTEHRGKPGTNYVSHMSKYLHFGQISPVAVALAARKAKGPEGDRDTFLEELIVRRELAQNFVHFTPDYDRYDGLPEWARNTLHKHRRDRREHLYRPDQLEAAATHDPYWNAAMREMTHFGYVHNHMRMYWGKKILEWSETPEEAYYTALRINNRYLLDGRDCNSFANIGWVFGNHDRPWPERPVLGTVRSMTADGLRRKADAEDYVRKVEEAIRREELDDE